MLSLPNSAWAGGNLAEWAYELGSNGAIPNFSSTKDSLRRAGPSCILWSRDVKELRSMNEVPAVPPIFGNLN